MLFFLVGWCRGWGHGLGRGGKGRRRGGERGEGKGDSLQCKGHRIGWVIGENPGGRAMQSTFFFPIFDQ